ncbi:1-deoxy-D-xylulose-5-phosphate reductoisomerase, partial [Francisella tularensis subsp. holarctica]|nr:1-deoxy-D-xylulose-5-phosphate reductoisomerase [Francisella tularensis subsp. holarctica]
KKCLPEIDKIILTASGGPVRDNKQQELTDLTPEQACNHPNWQMGRKLSVDSSTMVNNALVVSEASWLFSGSAVEIGVGRLA